MYIHVFNSVKNNLKQINMVTKELNTLKDTVNIDIETSKKWAGTDNVILSKVNIYVSVSCCCIPEPESR